MTNEEYVYRTEIRDKSQIARSAHKMYSKRRRGCRLPADSMTKKELIKMNGPIESITLNKPISWEELKKKPETIQIEYFNTIFSKYNIGPYTFAKALGISGTYCSKILKNLGYTITKKSSSADRARFLSDFNLDQKKQLDKEQAEKTSEPLILTTISLSFTGAFDSEAIAKTLTRLFPAGALVQIELTANRVADVAL